MQKIVLFNKPHDIENQSSQVLLKEQAQLSVISEEPESRKIS